MRLRPRPPQKQMKSVDEGSEAEAYPTTTALPRSNTTIGQSSLRLILEIFLKLLPYCFAPSSVKYCFSHKNIILCRSYVGEGTKAEDNLSSQWPRPLQQQWWRNIDIETQIQILRTLLWFVVSMTMTSQTTPPLPCSPASSSVAASCPPNEVCPYSKGLGTRRSPDLHHRIQQGEAEESRDK